MPYSSTHRPEWLDLPEIVRLFSALEDSQIEARFVGGCVRDSMLGLPLGDFDMATSSPPDQVIEALDSNGIRSVPTGIKHGTITAIVGKRGFEITTLRRDTECDGRHARVAFTDDWAEDAARRDFTVNALYLDREGTLYDYEGGLADLQTRTIRFIGKAEDRIAEDYLRALRYFRFLASHGRPPADPLALAACAGAVDKLGGLSGERIQQEMLKLLAVPDPLYALEQMQLCGPSAAVFKQPTGTQSLAALIHFEQHFSYAPPNPLLRLALMLRAGGKADATVPSESWKLSNKHASGLHFFTTVETLDASHLRDVERAIRKEGTEAVSGLLLRDLAESDGNAALIDAVSAALVHLRTWQPPVFPVSGKDLIAHGIAAGPEIGERLAVLETLWEESGYTLDKQALLATLTARA